MLFGQPISPGGEVLDSVVRRQDRATAAARAQIVRELDVVHFESQTRCRVDPDSCRLDESVLFEGDVVQQQSAVCWC